MLSVYYVCRTGLLTFPPAVAWVRRTGYLPSWPWASTRYGVEVKDENFRSVCWYRLSWNSPSPVEISGNTYVQVRSTAVQTAQHLRIYTHGLKHYQVVVEHPLSLPLSLSLSLSGPVQRAVSSVSVCSTATREWPTFCQRSRQARPGGVVDEATPPLLWPREITATCPSSSSSTCSRLCLC